MFNKFSRYLFKKGISDIEFIKVVAIVLLSTGIIGAMLYGAIMAFFI